MNYSSKLGTNGKDIDDICRKPEYEAWTN
jgi:hypothetical protein